MRKARGEVKRVGELFEKYRRTLIAPERTVINTFVEVVADVLSISIDKKSVRYNPATRTLSLTAPGMVKSEVNIHKKELLTHLKGRLGEKNAPTAIL